ncbi:MAG: hypothetical protein V2B18_06750, partial [Pseudomonadota bacterium]
MGMMSFNDDGQQAQYLQSLGWKWDDNYGTWLDSSGKAAMPESYQTQWGPVNPTEGQPQEMGSDSANYQRSMMLT